MIRAFESLLLPPGGLVILALAGLLLTRTRWRRAGVGLLVGALVLLYLLGTPLVAVLLMRPLDRYPPLDPGTLRPTSTDAIVVLSAGKRGGAREYGGDTTGGSGLERTHYAAWLHQSSGVPILVTGVKGGLMAQVMTERLGVEARWIEAESRNTHEHAVNCTGLFRREGIERIYLVTHYWHMPRAVASFEENGGVEVVPAPMGFTEIAPPAVDPRWILPGSGPLCASSTILHEWFGRLWYRLRYGY